MTAGSVIAQTGLPVPRFVTLRADEVNVRTGPGVRYPIEWVFTYRNMPVEIIAEFETWRKIRDWQGTIGWIHKSMLSGRRWVILRTGPQMLRRAARFDAPTIARVRKKVLGRLEKCQKGWCRVDFSGFTGWMLRKKLWGVYRDENIE
jgi:SH3-like domain-containing protein